MAARYGVGVDIGGTKIYTGIVNIETGEVLGTARRRTRPERGQSFFSERLFSVIETALTQTQLPGGAAPEAIGVGIAGQVDRASGLLLAAPNLVEGMQNFPVSQLLSERFRLPIVLGNDVEVATYGEQQFGAGKGIDDFACVFVGTGIGGAIVQNGTIRKGATGTAGEIGHTVLQYGGRICGCGGRGHLEAYASRTAITRVLLAELSRGRESKLRDLLGTDETAIRSKVIARCIQEGDELVTETLTEAADFLGAGLGSLATFYNPQRIIIGGGLIEAVEQFVVRAEHRAREVALPVPGRALEIVRAALGDNSGIVGAAWMAANRPASAVA
ncbi:MAG TPA: ROK family protein [Ktedonobacterales bacterium]|jgi:glucokinase|nr:ROK family protein [Ktedonobacterales bacterium]